MNLTEGEFAEFISRLKLLADQWETKAAYFRDRSLTRDDPMDCYSDMYATAARDLLAIVWSTTDNASEAERPEVEVCDNLGRELQRLIADQPEEGR